MTEKLKLAAPWTVFYRQVQALFKQDPEVKVFYDEDNGIIKLFVDNSTKADALSQLLPSDKIFGNVSLKIEVIPGNKKKTPVNLIHDAFDDNLSVSFIHEVETIFGDNWTFVVFQKEVIQFFNDNIIDIHGLCSTLMENIAREVLEQKDFIFYCTDTDGIVNSFNEWF